MNLIENVCEPARLVLTWQSPNLEGKERKRFGVADLFRTGDDATFVYRDGEEVTQARALGYSGYPAFRLDAREHPRALASFLRRLPPRDRSDFRQYLELFRLGNSSLSSFALLAYTEAKLPSDGFALVSELENACVPSEHLIELAGFRHYLENADGLEVGSELHVEQEPTNEFDSQAVVFRWNGKPVGYVNRFQAGTFNKWLESRDVTACFERRNGTSDRPRAYAFVKVR